MTERTWQALAARRTPARVFAWSRVSPLTVAAIGAALAAGALLATHSYAQPFSYNEAKTSLAPFAAALPALPLGLAFTNNMAALEVRAPRRLAVARLLWAATGIAALTAAATAIIGAAEPQWRTVILRNCLGLSGLALTAATLAGSRIAWIAVFAPTAAMFTAGRDGTTGEVHPWAVLLAPASSPAAALTMALAAIAGVVLYATFDSRPSSGVLKQ
ncbi:hypothetical protein [Micromonospora sp. DT229]|uniref:hypothetical protein n=1 Tax=Micromonospora sp. DT229 TaxID=3393430 RepID=UPI003CF7FE2C